MADEPRTRRAHDVDRLVAFSDGVFAIALTLLVLGFVVPDLRGANLGDQLWDFLREEWDQLLAYGLSVFVIGRFWIGHHQTFLLVHRTDPRLLQLNLLLLGLIALLPYPTALIGRYGETVVATVLYAAAVGAVGLVSATMWRHLWRAGLLEDQIDDARARHTLRRMFAMPALFAISIPLALVDPLVAQACWCSTFLAGPLMERFAPGGPRPASWTVRSL